MRQKDGFLKEKTTERQFHKVLISSICGILLCMTCLIGTTWAWFTVSVENQDNVIEIAKITPEILVTSEGASIAPTADGSYALPVSGTYSIAVTLTQEDKTAADANLLNNSKHPVYVVMTVSHGNDLQYRLFAFENGETEKTHAITLHDETATISFSLSWVKPATEALGSDTPTVIGTPPPAPTTPPATEPVTPTTTVPPQTTGEPDAIS